MKIANKTLKRLPQHIFFGGMLLCALAISYSLFVHFHQRENEPSRGEESMVIIFSPHFDDAVLSLGGFMAKQKHELVVATFFTQNPVPVQHTQWDSLSGFDTSDTAMRTRTRENESALASFNAVIKNYDYPDFQYRSENHDAAITKQIVQDIQALIEMYDSKKLSLYGPAVFTNDIIHPDHEIVHRAFVEVFRKNNRPNIHFYLYEDFPYIQKFMKTHTSDVNRYLEEREGIIAKERAITFTAQQLEKKISSVKTYTSQVQAFSSLGDNVVSLMKAFNTSRCVMSLFAPYACEVVHALSK